MGRLRLRVRAGAVGDGFWDALGLGGDGAGSACGGHRRECS